MRMAEKVIFWDFDGTLSLPNQSFFTALYSAVCQTGLEIDRTATIQFLENAYPWKTPMAHHADEVGENWWTTFYGKIDVFCRESGIPETALADIHNHFKQILADIHNYTLYEDTVYALKQCRKKGYQNYLLTNNYPEIIQNIEKLGITSYFTDFVVSSHVGYDKPRKELYEYAKKLAGNPSICYMIGDNPIADIRGGNDAGMQTIYVHNGWLADASFCVDRLSEIPELLE